MIVLYPGYYIRHRAPIYDSNYGGWWRYSDYEYTLQEAKEKYWRRVREYAATVQLVHVHEDLKEAVILESKADIGAKTPKA